MCCKLLVKYIKNKPGYTSRATGFLTYDSLICCCFYLKIVVFFRGIKNLVVNYYFMQK